MSAGCTRWALLSAAAEECICVGYPAKFAFTATREGDGKLHNLAACRVFGFRRELSSFHTVDSVSAGKANERLSIF